MLQRYTERVQSLVLSSEFRNVFRNSYYIHRVLDEHMISRIYKKSLVRIESGHKIDKINLT